MNAVIFGFSVVALTAITFVLADIAKTLRSLDESVRRMSKPLPIGARVDVQQHPRVDLQPDPIQSKIGTAVWKFENGTWQLERSECPIGYEPGPPPMVAGRWDGDRIKVECVRTSHLQTK